ADEQSGRTTCGTTCRGNARSGAGGAKGGDQGECGPAKHAPDSELDCACHRRWNAYGKWSPTLPSHTRGGSRMRESRTSGSVRGACDETHVPTATAARHYGSLAGILESREQTM